MPTKLVQHIEGSSRGPKRLQKFFGKVFDWKFTTPTSMATRWPSWEAAMMRKPAPKKKPTKR